MKIPKTALFAAAILAGLAGVSQAATPITDAEVLAAEKAWADELVKIGQVYTAGGDYKAEAETMVDHYYAYGDGKVMFKPTRAATDQFRETHDEALSYFVGGVDAEDHGFALQPWASVRFENDVIIEDGDSAEVMGNYYFTDAKTNAEVKVEFTMGFKRAADDHLELFLHHSSLPYAPVH